MGGWGEFLQGVKEEWERKKFHHFIDMMISSNILSRWS
jgi:hypothetical protein